MYKYTYIHLELQGHLHYVMLPRCSCATNQILNSVYCKTTEENKVCENCEELGPFF